MGIEIIDALSPRDFLEEVLQTSYPLGERVWDVAAFAVDLAKKAFVPSFLDPFVILANTCKVVLSDYDGQEGEIDYKKITVEKVHQIIGNKNEDVKNKLLFLIETSHELAKKMGLANVEIVLTNSLEEVLEHANDSPIAAVEKQEPARGGECGGRYWIVFCYEEIKEWDNNQLKFVIGHELAHSQHRDVSKERFFDWTAFLIKTLAFGYFGALKPLGIGIAIRGVVNLLQMGLKLTQDEDDKDDESLNFLAFIVQATVFWYFGVLHYFGLGMLMEVLAGMVQQGIAVDRETSADKKAMQILNSNSGAISLWHRLLKEHFLFKHIPGCEIHKTFSHLSREELSKIKCRLTPNGNDRAMKGPYFTSRLRSALNFKPKPQPATAPAA
jgi:peptidase M48-like protein